MPWAPSAVLLYLAPLLAALAVFETQGGRFPAIAEIQQMLRSTLLPILRRLSWWVSPTTCGQARLACRCVPPSAYMLSCFTVT